ncbi:MAG TPA: gamma-glutamyl-gamma-aminobutyrate hydrolase family protein [Fimbriimonadaceae bacterium]|nr:gamma-glutamyl-gamma-aminobutyrate hydrolase family protein [Fimbriimonadaceae bacterium]
MKPIIGIECSTEPDPSDARTQGTLSLNWNYADAVANAGGVPLLIPPQADPAEIVRILDGWLIPGGDDIDPREYGKSDHPNQLLLNPARYRLERAIYERIPSDLPRFGICYGCQFLNVMRGGSLLQHLPEVVGHEGHHSGELQTYCVEPGTRLAGIVGPGSIEGKSYHHQGIDRLGHGLRASSFHEDGTIEAIESELPFELAVQWHPERTLDDPTSQHLFEAFVDAARQYGERRRLIEVGR